MKPNGFTDARYQNDIAEYGNAIKLGINADNASVQIYLGAAYARAGKREQAQAIMKRLQARKDYVSRFRVHSSSTSPK